MGCSRGCWGVGCKLISKALPCILLVTFCLSVITTPVTAPSVAAAVRERLLTDQVAALKEIASALNRSVELVKGNFSWIKVSLFGLAGLLVTGVTTLYLADLLRKVWLHWGALRPPSLEDVFRPLTQQLSNKLDALGDQLAASLERTAKARMGLEMLKDELEPFMAYAKKGAEALDRMAMSTPYVERELTDLRSDMANLQTQLDAMRKADTERKEKKRKRKRKKKVELLEEGSRDSEPHPGDGLIDEIELECGSGEAPGFVSD